MKTLQPIASSGDQDCVVPLEKLITVQEAAEAIGFPVWKLRRAVKAGLIPSYSLLNSRRYVKLSEVAAAIQGVGGDQ
jgi:hypothetical protein